MFSTLVSTTVDHAIHSAWAGVPVQFAILGALIVLVALTIGFALMRCRTHGCEDCWAGRESATGR